jgi:hypothetical protein
VDELIKYTIKCAQKQGVESMISPLLFIVHPFVTTLRKNSIGKEKDDHAIDTFILPVQVNVV